MSGVARVDRRLFLVSVAAVGGSLALGFEIPFGPRATHASTPAREITAWIVIEPDETVIIRVAKSEMGQGSFTALPMLVAEELECDWSKVKAEFAPPHENRRRDRVWGNMSTGASRSISASHNDLRRAGATARAMLIAAAAARWNVPETECAAARGVITHLPSERTITFGRIAAAAADIAPPAQVALKDPKDWKLIGTRQRRFDVADKVTGKPIYAIDVQLPNMLHAAIVQCPVFKGTLKSVDETKLAGMKGIRQVVKLPDAVAVVADTWWRAKKAAETLAPTWDVGDHSSVSSSTISANLHEGLGAADARVGRNDGDVDRALGEAVKRIEANYEVPFLAHATMEPQNCTAHVTAELVEIWVPTQDGETALAIAADAAGVPPGRVVVHKMMLGGGFGRRGIFQDFVRQAVVIAKEVGQPVKLVWTREEDVRHDFYRPVAAARMTAGLDANGMPVAWKIRTAGQSIIAAVSARVMQFGVDRNFLQGLLEDMPYDVPNYLVDFVMRNTPVPVGVWRSVNHSQNAFFKESFVDEMAYAAGADPYLFRRKLLAKKPAELAVLEAAATHAGWGTSPPQGVFRGIALHNSQNSICAQVVEVSVTPDGKVWVHRVVSAIDPGHVVNPLTVELQTESAVVYGLAAVLYGEITIRDGRVEQANFHDYPMPRLAEMPRVETIIVASGGFWGGVGETAVPPLAPALCNAIFAATGKRIRSLPLKNHDLRSA
ncbi:MAG: xanthine dehydrogenase family protein molybdopterin-binding subunit [Hyphomicrobiales bacterium]|nr:xanthine dehydrogenase family protein molybdopterin-binding subunit [Hyphomicrobiales bacterium]